MNLKKLLKNSDTEIRRQAIESLRNSSDESAIEILLDAMKDESWRVRKTATEILHKQFRLSQYINGVISLLYLEDNAGARNSAIDLLVSIGKAAVPYLMDAFETDNHDVRKFVIDIIGEISDKRALPLLLSALKDEDENVKASAVEHLGRLKEPTVVDSLIEILESGDLWTAYPAADALGRICDGKAIPPLLDALDNKTLREPVLKALGCFSEPDTLDKIVPLLISGSRSVKEEVLKTIKTFYKKGVPENIIAEKIRLHLGDGALDILLKFAWSTKSDIRLTAILLLGMLKDSRAVKSLLDMSSEEDFREEIKRALVFIGHEHPDYILNLFNNLNISPKRFLTEIAVRIRNPLFYDLFTTFLRDGDGHVRALSAEGLAEIGEKTTVKKLLPLLNDGYIDVQEAAVDAIVKLREGIDVARFMEGLNDTNANIRRNSAYILGKIKASEAVPSLGFAVKDPEVNVRKAAVEALSMINDPISIKHIMISLTDESPDIRIAAAYALGKAGAAEATEALILLLSDEDESVRVAAVKSLGIHPDEKAVDDLVHALSDWNGFVVTAALETLSLTKIEKARDAIISMLSSTDEEIKRTAIRSLSNFEGIREKIKPFLNDPDWATRKTAVEVLGAKRDKSVVEVLEDIYDTEEDPTVKKTIEVVLSAHR